MLVACGGAAAALLARDSRLRYAAAALALLVAPILVAGDVWDSSRLVDLRHHPAKLAVAAGTAVLAVGVAAAVFRRVPWVFPVSVFAALSLRVPVQAAGQTAHLLVPMYLVIAAGLVYLAYGELIAGRRAGGEARSRPEPSPRGADPPATMWLRRAIAAMLVLYAIQSAYSIDVSNAIENAGFFLVPFAVLLMLMGEVRWTTRILGGALIAATGMALVFAAVGFGEYLARDLILSRGNLLESNQLHLYFRVNSLFYDPNIFGRYLALVLVALGAYLAWSRGRWAAIGVAGAAATLLAALALTYSITSFVALFAGLVVLAALRWGIPRALAGGAAALACGALVLLAIGPAHTDDRVAEGGKEAARGQVHLVEGGVELAGRRPGWGWGSGSFGAAFSRHIKRAKTTVSHTEPVTVAAEQGAIGLIAYTAVVVLALVVLLSGAGGSVAAAAVASCFVAMVVHSIGYADFATDPATWALLGLGLALRQGRPETIAAGTAGGADRRGVPRPPHDPRPAAV
jgi:hypothetical protein